VDPTAHVVHLDSLGAIKLWDSRIRISIPSMSASARTQLVDQDKRTVGFREAQFTDTASN